MRKSTSDKCVICAADGHLIPGALIDALQEHGVAAELSTMPDRCLRLLSRSQYNLFLVDCNGDPARALELVAMARNVVPQTPVLLLVERGDIRTAVKAIKAGATDCLEKPLQGANLSAALQTLRRQADLGHLDAEPALTGTETTVLHHVLQGRTNREIAVLLCRSRRTVEVHRRNVMRKLGAATLIDLIKKLTPRGSM